jgi:hypothetical protein
MIGPFLESNFRGDSMPLAGSPAMLDSPDEEVRE